MCKISIIVPVYNVQRYLDKCLKSVLSQTFQDIEVVAIDDGSTDRSGEILDSYAKRDIRLHVIHRENRGYGKTINQGIALAKGKYIAIVESDDWIEPDMLACLWDKAEQYDAEIARCGFYIYDSHQDPQNQNIVWDETAYMMSYNPDGVFIPMDYPENFVFHSAIWTYLYRTDFIKKIPFLENLRAYHDLPFMFEVLATAKRMVVVKKNLHHYRMEKKSGSTSMTKSKNAMQMCVSSFETKKALERLGILDKLTEPFYRHCVIANVYFFGQTPNKYKKQYFRELTKLFADSDYDFIGKLDPFSLKFYQLVKEKKFFICFLLFFAKEISCSAPCVYRLLRYFYRLRLKF